MLFDDRRDEAGHSHVVLADRQRLGHAEKASRKHRDIGAVAQEVGEALSIRSEGIERSAAKREQTSLDIRNRFEFSRSDRALKKEPAGVVQDGAEPHPGAVDLILRPDRRAAWNGEPIQREQIGWRERHALGPRGIIGDETDIRFTASDAGEHAVGPCGSCDLEARARARRDCLGKIYGWTMRAPVRAHSRLYGIAGKPHRTQQTVQSRTRFAVGRRCASRSDHDEGQKRASADIEHSSGARCKRGPGLHSERSLHVIAHASGLRRGTTVRP